MSYDNHFNKYLLLLSNNYRWEVAVREMFHSTSNATNEPRFFTVQMNTLDADESTTQLSAGSARKTFVPHVLQFTSFNKTQSMTHRQWTSKQAMYIPVRDRDLRQTLITIVEHKRVTTQDGLVDICADEQHGCNTFAILLHFRIRTFSNTLYSSLATSYKTNTNQEFSFLLAGKTNPTACTQPLLTALRLENSTNSQWMVALSELHYSVKGTFDFSVRVEYTMTEHIVTIPVSVHLFELCNPTALATQITERVTAMLDDTNTTVLPDAPGYHASISLEKTNTNHWLLRTMNCIIAWTRCDFEEALRFLGFCSMARRLETIHHNQYTGDYARISSFDTSGQFTPGESTLSLAYEARMLHGEIEYFNVTIPAEMLPPTMPNIHATVALVNSELEGHMAQYALDHALNSVNTPSIKFATVAVNGEAYWKLTTRNCAMCFTNTNSVDSKTNDIEAKFLEPYLGFDTARLPEELKNTTVDINGTMLEQIRVASYPDGRHPCIDGGDSGGRLANSLFVCAPEMFDFESFPVYASTSERNRNINVCHVLYRILLDSNLKEYTNEDGVDLLITNRQWLPITNTCYESLNVHLKLVLSYSDTYYNTKIQALFSTETYARITFRCVSKDNGVEGEEDNA
jgi:hypothetical protein